ncbi:MAG: hypothetical protein ACKO1L_02710, partial [Brachymonas sp.]
MENTSNLTEQRLADAWAVLQSHSQHIDSLKPDANRLAFADPEFLLRRELRGMRMQMEMLKPELGQTAAGVENTIVVFGGARFCSPEDAQAAWAKGCQAPMQGRYAVMAMGTVNATAQATPQARLLEERWLPGGVVEGRVVERLGREQRGGSYRGTVRMSGTCLVRVQRQLPWGSQLSEA